MKGFQFLQDYSINLNEWIYDCSFGLSVDASWTYQYSTREVTLERELQMAPTPTRINDGIWNNANADFFMWES